MGQSLSLWRPQLEAKTKPFPGHMEPGHMIMQDDLSKKESFKDSREINHVYFSSGYAGAFPWKIVPMPYLDGKILNESVSWRHPEGNGVFLTGKATREPSRQLCAIPATAPFRADCRIGESCLGKQDRPGLKHWFLVQVSQWNVNEKFSTSSCPDSPCQNLWSPRLGQRTSISGGHPARVAPWINSLLCCSSIMCLLFAGKKKKKKLHPPDFCFIHLLWDEPGQNVRKRGCCVSPLHWIQTQVGDTEPFILTESLGYVRLYARL